MKKMLKHFVRITKHKWIVLKLCIKAGIPYRGLVHDLSKYSPTEFFESCKYYENHSPIEDEKRKQGYSKAWLHHKGRNKHHSDYWYDPKAPIAMPILPYKYAVEMVCDNLAAGLVYNGKAWENDTQLNYWNIVENREYLHQDMKKFVREIYTQVSNQGIDKTIRKRNLQEVYQKYCCK